MSLPLQESFACSRGQLQGHQFCPQPLAQQIDTKAWEGEGLNLRVPCSRFRPQVVTLPPLQ